MRAVPTYEYHCDGCGREFEVKQRIMSHEYEELIEDEHSKHGHLDLIFRQGKEVGLSVEDILAAQETQSGPPSRTEVIPEANSGVAPSQTAEASGTGDSKQEAEQAAAGKALEEKGW